MVQIGQLSNNIQNTYTPQLNREVNTKNTASIFEKLDTRTQSEIDERFAMYDLNSDGSIDANERNEIEKNDASILSKLKRLFGSGHLGYTNKTNFEDQIHEYRKLPSASGEGQKPELNDLLCAKNMEVTSFYNRVLTNLDAKGIDYTLNNDGTISYKDGDHTIVARKVYSDGDFGGCSYVRNDIYDSNENLVQTICTSGTRSNGIGTHVINYDINTGKAITYNWFENQ